RKALEADAREGREAALAALEIGKTVRGTVTAVRDFGAFVDLGGVEGLIPRSGGGDRVTAGDAVEAVVLEIKDDPAKGQKRITLALAGAAEAAKAPRKALDIGAIVKGRVVRIETYGVFLQVEGTEGRDGRGLVPVSELDTPRGADLR